MQVTLVFYMSKQNVPVNQSTQFHHYKAFFNQLINTTRDEKSGPSEIEGYYWEDASDIDQKTGEPFKSRMKLFKSGQNYTTAPIKLTGFLYHDLMRNQAGIPPGVTYSSIPQFISKLHSEIFCNFRLQ